MFPEGPVTCTKFAHISFTAACAALVKVASLSLAPAQRFEGKVTEKLKPASEVACRYHFYRPLQCSARAGALFLQVTSPVPRLLTLPGTPAAGPLQAVIVAVHCLQYPCCWATATGKRWQITRKCRQITCRVTASSHCDFAHALAAGPQPPGSAGK